MAGLACARRSVTLKSSLIPFLEPRRCRTITLSPVRCDEAKGHGSQQGPGVSSRGTLSRRRWSLSPLERISRLLPQDHLSPDLAGLRDPEGSAVPGPGFTQEGQEDPDPPGQPDPPGVHPDSKSVEEGDPTLVPGERLLAFGELLVAEHWRKGRVEFRKMFQLRPGARLMSSWGFVAHDDVVGQRSGQTLRTGRGVPILLRRPSLEDYVLLMKRSPAIAYPKDAATMLMMMDVSEGDRVLESGSGSGAMSLFLSRAVGSKGCVTSVEVREDHHRRAVLNYEGWRRAWSVRRGEEWPDNVCFHNADLCEASPLLSGRGFHAAALDLINPHLVLPTVTPHLYPGAVCAVYLANITQVIDLLEGLRCLALPLLCERIIEAPLRHWMVAPALKKDGSYCIRKPPVVPGAPQEEEEEAAVSSSEGDGVKRPEFGSVPYVARPHPEQMSHTAFLIKLRKCAR